MAKSQDPCPSFKTMCGGQALIEGIMMRGPEKEAIVVRKPDGELEVKVEPLKLIKTRHPVLGLPFIRGPINFIDSMVHGVKALLYSAEFYPDEETGEKAADKAARAADETVQAVDEATETVDEAVQVTEETAQVDEAVVQAAEAVDETVPAVDEAVEAAGETAQAADDKAGKKKKESKGDGAMGAAAALALVLGLGLSILLFFILPTLITGLLTPYLESRLVLSLIEGVVRMVIFLLYIILTSRIKDMARTYSYHGAEHKTIFCYERGLPLTVENVREMPRHHPRCGTSFLFVIMCVAILIHAVLGIGWDNTWIRLAVRLLSLPIIISITYELNRFVGRHDNRFTRVLTAPGLWLQNFTTNEPDDSMIQVGIRALQEVLPEERGADRW